MNLKKINQLILFFSSLFSIGAVSAEDKFTVSTGFDFSTGKYGQAEKTNITYVPLTGKYESEYWTFKVTVPWLEIDGPGGVTADSRVVTGSGVGNSRVVESGIGDTVLGATYSAFQFHEKNIYVDLGAKVKLPTASESKGLGTGEVDYTLLGDIYKTMDHFTVLGTLGYKIFGDPTGINLNNVWFGTVGGVYKFNHENSAGVMVDLREATTSSGTDLREYTLFYSHKFNDAYKMQSYVVKGDTRSSVDWSIGASLSASW
jgi:hypothetical protein